MLFPQAIAIATIQPITVQPKKAFITIVLSLFGIDLWFAIKLGKKYINAQMTANTEKASIGKRLVRNKLGAADRGISETGSAVEPIKMGLLWRVRLLAMTHKSKLLLVVVSSVVLVSCSGNANKTAETNPASQTTVAKVCNPPAQTHCAGANLSDVNLSGADLVGADFSGANLTNANLSGAIPIGLNQPFRHSSSAFNVPPVPRFSNERSRGRTRSVPIFPSHYVCYCLVQQLLTGGSNGR